MAKKIGNNDKPKRLGRPRKYEPDTVTYTNFAADGKHGAGRYIPISVSPPCPICGKEHCGAVDLKHYFCDNCYIEFTAKGRMYEIYPDGSTGEVIWDESGLHLLRCKRAGERRMAALAELRN